MIGFQVASYLCVVGVEGGRRGWGGLFRGCHHGTVRPQFSGLNTVMGNYVTIHTSHVLCSATHMGQDMYTRHVYLTRNAPM